MKRAILLRYMLPLLAILLLVAGGAFIFQRQIGLILEKMVIDKRVTMDLAAEQPNGLLFVMPADSDVIHLRKLL